MKPLIAIVLVFVVFAIWLSTLLTPLPVVTTTDKTVVRAFMADCDGHVLVREIDEVYELRCRK